MSNAMKVAARILCACLLIFGFSGIAEPRPGPAATGPRGQSDHHPSGYPESGASPGPAATRAAATRAAAEFLYRRRHVPHAFLLGADRPSHLKNRHRGH